MALLRRLACLLLAAGATAQHLSLDIPEVDAAVKDAQTKNANYTNYKAPGNLTTASSNLTRPSFNTLVAVSDPPYWYADITHQGISAFNPGYQVFRNVKDFGAMGKSPGFVCIVLT